MKEINVTLEILVLKTSNEARYTIQGKQSKENIVNILYCYNELETSQDETRRYKENKILLWTLMDVNISNETE